MFARIASIALLLLFLPALALAQPPISAPIQLPDTQTAEDEEGPGLVDLAIGIFGSANTYGMGSLNSNISVMTDSARALWGAPEITLEDVSSGVGYGFNLQAFLKNKFLISAEYSKISGTSDVGGQLGRSEIQVPATAILGTIGYCLFAEDVRFGVAAGFGRYDADGTGDFIVDEELVESVKFTGDTFGQHYGVFVETPLLNKFKMLVMLGYRGAKVDELTVDLVIPEPGPDGPNGEPPPPPDLPFPITTTSLDWSGFMGRATLLYYLF